MAQRFVLTHGNPDVSYRTVAKQADDALETVHDGVADSALPDLAGQRFPGWLRLAIIGAGAALTWGAVAFAVGWLR